MAARCSRGWSDILLNEGGTLRSASGHAEKQVEKLLLVGAEPHEMDADADTSERRTSRVADLASESKPLTVSR